MNENTVWTDSQDYGADEILYTSKITLLYKTTRFTSEIITLFRVSPQLFQVRMSHFQGSVPAKCTQIHKRCIRLGDLDSVWTDPNFVRQ